MSKTRSHHWIIYVTALLIILSAIRIIFQNGGMIQTSADFSETTPFWHLWMISGLPLILLFLLPKETDERNPFSKVNPVHLRKQTALIIACAIIFYIAMMITPEIYVFDLFYVYKLVFLLIIPLVIILKQPLRSGTHSYLKNNKWLFPLIVTGLWIYLFYFSPISMSTEGSYEIPLMFLIIGASVSFLMNSVLEELFYRVWLQTRLEALLGTWPAISVTAVLWALWHAAIMGDGHLGTSSANALVTHGITGLFLGFLWVKYRNIWVLIIIHGLTNFPVQIIREIIG